MLNELYETFKIDKSWKHYTVMCIDDDLQFLEYLKHVLEPFFLEIITFSSAIEAIERLSKQTPDIIITDLCMPLFNGIDFVKQLRNNNNNTSLIFLTAYFETNYLLDAVPLKINTYLIKPVTLEDLFSALQKSILQLEAEMVSSQRFLLHSGYYIDLSLKTILDSNKNNIKIMTKKEFALLELLLKNKATIMSNEMIQEYLWPIESVKEGSVKALIKKVRDKLGYDTIKTHNNIGYSIALYEK